MAQTQIELECHLPREIASLAHNYIKPLDLYDDNDLGNSGHGELCVKHGNVDTFWVVYYNCYRELEVAMIIHNKYQLDDWLWLACERMDTIFVKVLLDYNADPNTGLYIACARDRRDIAQLLIAHGATDWNAGVLGACVAKNNGLIKMMIKHGATKCECGGLECWYDRYPRQEFDEY